MFLEVGSGVHYHAQHCDNHKLRFFRIQLRLALEERHNEALHESALGVPVGLADLIG
jgi:hypothetical protein